MTILDILIAGALLMVLGGNSCATACCPALPKAANNSPAKNTKGPA